MNLNAQSKVSVGMTVEELKEIYPDMKMARCENTITLTRTDNLYGLDAEWGYRFEDQKLNWIFFHKYIDEINKVNFNKCLISTRKIINDFTGIYGQPDTTVTGDTTFVDPYEKRHWGYDVIEARWNNFKGMKIKVEFTFMGGKGEYHFLVKINYFSKDYPYFD